VLRWNGTGILLVISLHNAVIVIGADTKRWKCVLPIQKIGVKSYGWPFSAIVVGGGGVNQYGSVAGDCKPRINNVGLGAINVSRQHAPESMIMGLEGALLRAGRSISASRYT
jgi:hypothetical protein